MFSKLSGRTYVVDDILTVSIPLKLLGL